ncbi:uncharacterized protein LOC135693265 isoform X1 [Rhopilema esculentum]|uniref:uncharacterized protein LOC135693265 isoform X1 n=1 Tax=Rhopilema esculentum TaxID=499914 RepID=UPI0031D1AA32
MSPKFTIISLKLRLFYLFIQRPKIFSFFLVKTKELTDTKQRLSEVTEKLSDKGRQLQRLQTMYDSLRRKSVNPAILTEHYGNTEVLNAMKTSFTLPIGTTSGIPKALPNEIDMPQRPVPDATPNREFHFTPVPMAESNYEQIVFDVPKQKTYQNRFHLELNTPRAGAK